MTEISYAEQLTAEHVLMDRLDIDQRTAEQIVTALLPASLPGGLAHLARHLPTPALTALAGECP
jgi:hypothetical protein